MPISPFTVPIDIGRPWRLEFFFVLLTAFFTFIFPYRHRIGNAAIALWSFALLMALFLSEYPTIHFGQYERLFQVTSSWNVIEVFTIPLLALSFSRYTRWRVWSVLPFLLLFEIACVWLHREGLLVASSFSLAMIALVLPLMPNWFKIVALATIVTHHGSTALVILAAQILAGAALNRKYRKYLLVLPILVLLSRYHQFRPHFDSAERLGIYKEFMSAWWSELVTRNPLVFFLGTGPGTFFWISLMRNDFAEPQWWWLHSDFLQILFELGAIGFTLSLLTVWAAIKRNLDDSRMVSAIVGIVAFSLTYHPLRWAPTAFLVCLIFASAFQEEEI